MKKRALIASLLFVGAIGLTGCGGGSTSSSQETSKTPTSETPVTSETPITSETPVTSETPITSETPVTSETPSIPDGYELVESVLNVSSDDFTTSVLTEDLHSGPFTILSTSEIRTRSKVWTDPANSSNTLSFSKSIKIGKTSAGLKVKVNGTGTLSFAVQNGSSGVNTRDVIITRTNGSTITKVIPGNISSSSDYPEYPDGSPVVMVSIDVTDGEYTINRDSGTIDIYYAKLSVVTEIAEENGFKITSNGLCEYVEGQAYNPSKIGLNVTYANGKEIYLPNDSSDVKIDSSSVNTSVPGTYQVSVQYKQYPAQYIDVTVYELEDIELGFNRMEKSATNTSVGNGQYINNPVRQVYSAGSTLNHDNLTVTAKCKHPTNITTKDFIMDESFITVESPTFNSGVDGSYDVNVKLSINNKQKEQTYKVHVVSAQPSEVNEVIQLKVDGTYQGTIGAVVEQYNMFSTIQQALEYIENLGSTYDAKQKLLFVNDGLYEEKLEVKIPNLHIVGANKDTVKIEWDSLVGVKDESGFIHETDSTATVAIREKAKNCVIENITISNFFNSEANFEARFGAGYPEHRALALLVQSDQFIMKDSKLLGYQDTVEFFYGRQLILNTYISGTTDFIFGTNNTTLFKGCQIHSIDNAKGNGGYITAFKGCNKGEADSVKYGAIFDDCDFTADPQTLSLKKTSMGRTWGAYAAVMVMNSRIGAHVSTKASTGASQNERYVAMNGGSPAGATVQFTEYNNTGDGAITETMAGVKVLEKAEADNYNNLSVIFAKTNGHVTYSEDWNVTL